MVPSTFTPGEEGVFTLSLMADVAFELEEVAESLSKLMTPCALSLHSNSPPV